MMKTEKITPEKLEGILLSVSENVEDSLQKLNKFLLEFIPSKLPSWIHKTLVENLSLIIGEVESIAENKSKQNLILQLFACGIDSMLLRDALASLCRNTYSSYPDPSGLIQALGIFEMSISPKEIYRRWEVFSNLRKDGLVWHKSYGLGEIKEIDSLSDLVSIKFNGQQDLKLAQCLTTLFVAKRESMTFQLWKKSLLKFTPDKSAEEFDRCISIDFVPPLEFPSPVTEALLVPGRMTRKALTEWRNSEFGTSATPNKKVQERVWNNARSLEELKLCIQKTPDIRATENDIHHLSKIFKAEANKPLSKFVFTESLTLLWFITSGADWIVKLIRNLPEGCLAWSSKENFVEVTCRLPSKLIPSWHNVSDQAQGRDWLVNSIVELPLKYWPSAKHPLIAKSNLNDELAIASNNRIKSGSPSADVILWNWRNRRENKVSSLSNPGLILRVLNQNVKGEYLRAKKELQKLLMEDRDFQKTLMNFGSESGIRSFVKSVKATSVLNKGEQQSLLVKVIRIYPEAQNMVEERKKVISRRPLPKLTSFRSFDLRRQELQEIINTKIPKNSAAIAHARSYGDLRENAEFKAAKEEQRLLMSRRSELEKGLKEVMPTDFSEVRILETVIPGSSVEVVIAENQDETYHILGLWDSIPEKNILSYDTPLGRILIGKKVGEPFTTPQNQSGKIKVVKALPKEILEWVSLLEASQSI